MLCILLVASLLPRNVAYENLETFTIAAIFSRKSTDVENSLWKAEAEVVNRNILPNGTMLRVQPFVLENFSTSLQSSLVGFCDMIVSRNISVVIIVGDLGESVWVIPWISSRLRIPVSLAYNSRTIGENKGEFSTVFSMVPSLPEISDAVGGLLQYFGWKNLGILTGSGKEDFEITGRLVEGMRFGDRQGVKVLFHRQFNPQDHEDLDKQLKELTNLDVTAIFLHCNPSDVKSIFSAAKRNGLLKADRVWIVSEAVIEGCSVGASDCPSGLIGLRLRRTCDPGVVKKSDVTRDLVQDSVMLYAVALRKLLRDGKPLGIPPSSCEDKPLDGGEELFKYIINTSIHGTTGLIKFDAEGNRVQPEYEIINLKLFKNATREWVPVAFWVQGVVDCNGNKFEWPGGTEFPPVDKAHERHLQVVTAATEPFVCYSGMKHSKNEKIVCAKGYPCMVYHVNKTESGRMMSCCEGLVIELLKMLEIDVGFHSDLHIVKDGKYGAKDARTGEWNGMIGEILRGEADFAIADLTITDSRSRVVDFSHPFLQTGMSIMVSVEKKKSDWLVRFLVPYSWDLWLAAVGTLNVVFLALWILDRISPNGRYRRSTTVKEKKKFDIVASFWFTWGTIFHIDESEARPKSFSARAVTVCFAFGMTILTTSYTANLAAVLVSESESFPVSNKGIRDPKLQNPPQDFKLGTVSDTSLEKLFKESNDPMYIRIWSNMRRNGVDTFAEGVEELVSGELDAFIGDEPTLLYAASKQKNCQLRLVGKSFFQSGFGLAFPKKSLWTKKFSDVLLSYEQFSIPQKLRETWLSGTCSKQDPLTVSGFLKMTVEDVSGAFMIVFIGMGLALLLLLVEFKVAKYGFPLSRIWTNDPNWKAERKFIPNLPSVKTPSSSDILELSFSRRRSNFLCTREETNASIHGRPRGSVYDEFADELSGNRLSDNELSRIDQLHLPHGESDLHLVVEDSDSGRGSLGNSKNAK